MFRRFSLGTSPALRHLVARLSTSYEPRYPAGSALYQIVRDHFETFREQAASLRDGDGLPRCSDTASSGPTAARAHRGTRDRPAGERLRVTGDGQVLLHPRPRWTDGTTLLVFDPLEWLRRS